MYFLPGFAAWPGFSLARRRRASYITPMQTTPAQPSSAAHAAVRPLRVRQLGQCGYRAVWRAMRDFTERRGPDCPDELWLLQHPPVYTLGLGGRREHVLASGGIEVVHSDRGGQATYHGPGQLLAYALVDLRRRGLAIRRYVRLLEQSVMELLADLGVAAERRPGAPGVYVGGAKIAALGVRVRRGCAYHGLALNVDLDLTPFAGIEPCGIPGLRVTCLAHLRVRLSVRQVAARLVQTLARQLECRPDCRPGGLPDCHSGRHSDCHFQGGAAPGRAAA